MESRKEFANTHEVAYSNDSCLLNRSCDTRRPPFAFPPRGLFQRFVICLRKLDGAVDRNSGAVSEERLNVTEELVLRRALGLEAIARNTVPRGEVAPLGRASPAESRLSESVCGKSVTEIGCRGEVHSEILP